jgi:hypothetical protein
VKIPAGLARHALKLEQNKPNILFGVGVVGSVASTVLACRATLKLELAFEKANHDKREAGYVLEDRNRPEYDEKSYKSDLTKITIRTAVDVGRLYAPAVIVGAASIAALTKSHTMLNDRLAGVTAAYAALERAYESYRQRVIEKYGVEQDEEFRFPREKVKEQNPETGRDHTVEVVKDTSGSPYARFFDELSTSWSRDAEINFIFLKNQQNYFNDKLRARGFVFLNEVYEQLGIPASRAGAVVGWTILPGGDGYIDFGIFDGENSSARMFVNGHEKSILLDFNVDGVIYNKIEQINEELYGR